MELHDPALDSADFGTLLRKYRLAAGLSQEALAERARMSINGIGALERGERRTPQRETLSLLITALSLEGDRRRRFEAAARQALSRRVSSVAVGPWAAIGGQTLPFSVTSFVGRARELGEIVELISNHRFVTITGAGGVGKTQIALHVGRRISDGALSTVCFVPLVPIADAALVETALASVLGIQEVPNMPLTDTLKSYLREKKLLIILDNCEHVIYETALLAKALLAGCQHLRILTTSREPLHVSGERTYRLPSLRVPAETTTRELKAVDAQAYDAVELFVDRARATDYRFTLTDENAPFVARICRRMDGIPLAIELAAARIGLLSPSALLDKIDDRFDVLVGGDRTSESRQQTMYAAIDWSYKLLAENERRVFERLAVFADGCTLAMATAVCADEKIPRQDILTVLSSLVDKSLLQADLERSDPRYQLFESFREYGAAKLAGRGEVQVMARRLACACLELVERVNRRPMAERTEFSIGLAYDELDNFRAVLRWALIERGDVPLGQRLAGQLLRGFRFFAPPEAIRWSATAIALIDEQTPRSVSAHLHLAAGFLAGQRRRFAAELSSAERAREDYRALNDLSGVVLAQCDMGHALIYLGRRREAAELLRDNLVVARGLADSEPSTNRSRARLGFNLRLLAIAGDDIDAARDHIGEALSICQEVGDWAEIALTLSDLSECEYSACDVESALRHSYGALQALTRMSTIRPDLKSVILNEMALYLGSSGQYDDALKRAREALDNAREYQLDSDTIWALETIAGILVLKASTKSCTEGTPEKAGRILGFAGKRHAILGSARYDFAQKQLDEAVATLGEMVGTKTLENLLTDGAAMAEEAVVELALAP